MILEKYILKEVEKGDVGFCPMLFLGYPDLETSKKAISIIEELGYTVFHTGIPVNYGFPVTDPLASVSVRLNCSVAFRHVTAEDVLQYFSNIRPNLLTVFPTTIATGKNALEIFFEKISGKIDSALIPGALLPQRSRKELWELSQSYKIDVLGSADPTMNSEELNENVRYAEGFIYLRGASSSNYGVSMYPLGLIQAAIDAIKKKTDTPIGVGVGMKTPEEVRATASLEGCDMVILATEMMMRLNWGLTALRDYVTAVKAAIKDVKKGRAV